MNIIRSIFLCFSMLTFSVSPSFPLQSAIETLTNLMPAIVSIKAEGAGMFRSPGGQAFRDAKTGRILVARSVRTAQFSRQGAGVIIDASGIIVTNAHTVEQATRITVTLNNDQSVAGELISIVPNEDIAFVRIPPPYPLLAIPLADSNSVSLRDRVYTIGGSEVLHGTLSEGKVSGIGKSAKAHGLNDFVDLIQTTFNVYRGDSGGPLIDSSGNLLGMITANKPRAGHVSYAIPSNKIKQYYQEYLGLKK